MYFVDRQKIEKNLTYLEKHIQLFQESQQWDSEYSKLSLERIAHVMMDCILDVGNALIDGFMMRDPGSYEDIVDILLDEKVITKEMEEQFKQILPLRRMIVQEYLTIDHEQIYQVLHKNLPAVAAYPQAVRKYLVDALGPVSAFLRE